MPKLRSLIAAPQAGTPDTLFFKSETGRHYHGKMNCIPLLTLTLGMLLVPGARSAAADAADAHSPKHAKAPKEGKEAKTEAREAFKEKRAADKEKHEEQRDQRVDGHAKMRHARQVRRIEDGIMHGNLTQEELSKLRGQQSRIEALRKAFTADGKVTKEEASQLRSQLNDASAAIFAGKNDAQGKAKGVFGFGHSIVLKQDVADRLGSGALSRKDARGFLADFRELTYTKWRLSSEDMRAAERATTQERYNLLLNSYFEHRN
jgi:hypothetical protein